MSAKEFAAENLTSLLELEIAVIERYYKSDKLENNISLIYFKIPQNTNEYKEIFEKILRNTDIFLQENEHFIALLYGTDKNGASILLSDIQEFLSDEPIDLVVSYPQDGVTAEAIITKLQDEIKDNYDILLECLIAKDRAPLHEL